MDNELTAHRECCFVHCRPRSRLHVSKQVSEESSSQYFRQSHCRDGDQVLRGNLDLMKAVYCLLPQSPSFLDVGMLSPLQKLTYSTGSDRLCNEILVAKDMLENRFLSADADLSTICKYVQEFRAAFRELHRLYVTSLVIGVSSAACKSSFSTLSRVLTPLRRTMLHERKRNMVILAHEKAKTAGLDIDALLGFLRTELML